MTANRLFLVGLLLSTNFFRTCVNSKSNQIKADIAKFEDRRIAESKVSLYNKNKYYIGFRKDVHDAYYLAFSIDTNSSYEICKVVTQKNGIKVDSMNNLIIEANRKLNTIGLKSTIIYDDTDSLRIVLLNSKNLSINSVATVKI